jgi:6-pyruvoyltetrahydropterin/6-carboxytetrahydropterin synthase
MHGHNYFIEVFIGSETLDEQGMVMDFGDIKKIIDELLGSFDHKHLGVVPEGWTGNSEHIIPLPFMATTAENLAKYWGSLIQEKVKPLKLVKIDVHETPMSQATWIP